MLITVTGSHNEINVWGNTAAAGSRPSSICAVVSPPPPLLFPPVSGSKWLHVRRSSDGMRSANAPAAHARRPRMTPPAHAAVELNRFSQIGSGLPHDDDRSPGSAGESGEKLLEEEEYAPGEVWMNF